MKIILTFCCVVFLTFCGAAQCRLVINGKEYASGDFITKSELSKACVMQMKNDADGKTSNVVTYSWMITHIKEVYHGKSPDDCPKLKQHIEKLASGDLFLFYEIKCRETTKCNGQYILYIK